MKSDKASLPYGGGLLWEHQIQIVSEVGADEILISGPRDGVYANSGYAIIPDEHSERGPIEGLRVALTQARHGHVLLLAIDLPRMTGEYLRKLRSQCLPGRGVVGRDKAYEPLAAFYPKELLPIVESRIRQKKYSFQELISEAELLGLMTGYSISKEELDLFYNWNSRELDNRE